MKPIEFVRKYDLQSGWKPRVKNSFLQDMTNELLAFCEVNRVNDNIKAFDNAVKVVRMKWDAISRKIAGGLPEKLWNYWWATVVVKIRAELCPTEERRRVARQAARQAEYEERKRQEEEISELHWVEWSQAMEAVTFKNDRNLLNYAREYLTAGEGVD